MWQRLISLNVDKEVQPQSGAHPVEGAEAAQCQVVGVHVCVSRPCHICCMLDLALIWIGESPRFLSLYIKFTTSLSSPIVPRCVTQMLLAEGAD